MDSSQILYNTLYQCDIVKILVTLTKSATSYKDSKNSLFGTLV